MSALNLVTTGSDHRIVRAKLMIDVGKERHKLIKKTVRPWNCPSDITGFQRCITDSLNSTEAEENINILNDLITTTGEQNQILPKTKKESKISCYAANAAKKRHGSAEMTNAEDFRQINKEISKVISF